MSPSSDSTHEPTTAYRFRGLIALLGVAGVTLALGGAAAAVYHGEVATLAILSVALFTQVFLLAPKRNWTTQITTSGRPMRRTIVIFGGMFAILSIGLVSLALEVMGTWDAVLESDDDVLWQIAVVLSVLWLFWICVFLFLRDWGPRYLRLRKMVHALIAGSLLQSIVATGVLATAPDPDDCICARGSFIALFLSGCVALWAFGPATVLVFWERKAQREFVRRRCHACKKRLANSVRAGFDHCRHCNAPLTAAVARQTQKG